MGSKVVPLQDRMAIAVALSRLASGTVTVSQIARDFSCSRTTVYAYRDRLAADGLAGLVDRSRAAHVHPNQTPASIEELVVGWRKRLADQGSDHGAVSVRNRMRRAGLNPPSARTIHRIFVRWGLVTPQPRKRPRSSWRRFAATSPNGVWQLDGMAWHLHPPGRGSVPVVIIRVIDDYSRRAVGLLVADSESAEETWTCLSEAFERYGRPAMVLSDNSLAFNGSRRGREVTVQTRLRELGIAQVASSNHHPQTCGKNEREHQTMQKWLNAHPPAATKNQLYRVLMAYEDDYNHHRPHQGLGGTDGLTTPAEAYQATPKATAADHPLPAQPRARHVKVSSNGAVSCDHANIHIGREWSGTQVTVIRDGNHAAIFHNGDLIAAVTLDPHRRYHSTGRKRGGPQGRQPRPRVTS